MDMMTVIFMYINLGLEHILTGYDHLLFLLALIIVSERFAVILKIVTAFTIAHSITLCLAALGLIPVYPKWIEAGIALTICYVAVENFFVRSFRWRWVLTFLFGLIHGLGFASSISEIGFHTGYLVTSLVSFNVGIELGQLGIVAVLLPILSRLRKQTGVYTWFFRATSACILVIGLYWVVERIWGGV
ncbi:HupE/UreJ family protein [Paenibacillus sp. NPDC056579]|uniref:HupE/UreJ family protein n=1 Tax=unclassified Paenibacillus TaxID=185978 RepID=UPI001EF8A72F|nr:HupE/UreJ family protein [Paenibacillus sp. H1-7]ULL18272.1 HupE/UreJ family protein [Paenibacillus sp. H1-7]